MIKIGRNSNTRKKEEKNTTVDRYKSRKNTKQTNKQQEYIEKLLFVVWTMKQYAYLPENR